MASGQGASCAVRANARTYPRHVAQLLVRRAVAGVKTERTAGMWFVHYGHWLPLPFALAVNGSVVRRTFYGVTPWHARDRADRWIVRQVNREIRDWAEDRS